MTFDVRDHFDRLRCHETSWLLARCDELVAEERRIHVEKLAVLAILDERRAIARDRAAQEGISERTLRAEVETARRLEALPEVAAAAHDGRLSAEQLAPITELADEWSDREWAQRAEGVAPSDLARMARTTRTPTLAEAQRRRAARKVWFAERPDTGMVDLGGSLPDVDGVFVKGVLDHMAERMRPAKGQPWDTRAHRLADALVEVCRHYADCHDTDRGGVLQSVLVVQVPLEGPAEVAGIPLADEVVAELRAGAKVEPVLVDERNAPVAVGRARSQLSPKVLRAILARDGHRCRCGCDGTLGLHVHHLVPRAWGGTDDSANLATVCGTGSECHPMLVPHGDYVLEGNPNLPDGLRLVHWTDAKHVHPPPEWAAARRQRARPG